MLKLKSSREIEAMRKAGLVVWEAHQIAKRLVRPGVTTGEISALVAETCAYMAIVHPDYTMLANRVAV